MRRRRLDERAAEDTDERVTVEEQIDLATAVQRLPPGHRAVVHLFYREELSVEEIALVLGIPAGTVKSRLHHARETLRLSLRVGAPGRREPDSRGGRIP